MKENNQNAEKDYTDISNIDRDLAGKISDILTKSKGYRLSEDLDDGEITVENEGKDIKKGSVRSGQWIYNEGEEKLGIYREDSEVAESISAFLSQKQAENIDYEKAFSIIIDVDEDEAYFSQNGEKMKLDIDETDMLIPEPIFDRYFNDEENTLQDCRKPMGNLKSYGEEPGNETIYKIESNEDSESDHDEALEEVEEYLSEEGNNEEDGGDDNGGDEEEYEENGSDDELDDSEEEGEEEADEDDEDSKDLRVLEKSSSEEEGVEGDGDEEYEENGNEIEIDDLEEKDGDEDVVDYEDLEDDEEEKGFWGKHKGKIGAAIAGGLLVSGAVATYFHFNNGGGDGEDVEEKTDWGRQDADGDGIINVKDPNPYSVDADGDGIPDAKELRYGLDPNEANSVLSHFIDEYGEGSEEMSEIFEAVNNSEGFLVNLGGLYTENETATHNLIDSYLSDVELNQTEINSIGLLNNKFPELMENKLTENDVKFIQRNYTDRVIQDLVNLTFHEDGNISNEDFELTADPDGDELINYFEEMLGTDPNLADTDGDGTPDREDGYPLNDQKD